MKVYLKNNDLKTYEPDIMPLINSFFPGAELVKATKFEDINLRSPADCACGDRKYKPAASGILDKEPEQPYNSGSDETDVFIDIDEICGKAERFSDRFYDKSSLKKALYIYLSGITGRELPWGTLTGIRPVKIAEKYELQQEDEALKDHASNEISSGSKLCTDEVCGRLKNRYAKLRELRNRLKADFLISEEKLDLLLDIYEREKDVLSHIDYKNGCSIYIGIPFCPTRCVYCSFTAYPFNLWQDRAHEYIGKIGNELKGIVDIAAETGKRIQTVYVGGGTPSVFTAELIEELMQTVERHIDISTLAEFTFEAGRPDTITKEKLGVLKRHGVTRISINPQTMCQKTLDLIGRKHTAEQIKETFVLARSMGFDNINMDIIAGLPGENADDFRYTLSEIGKLDPDNLTVHTLAVKRASRLNTEGNAWGGIKRAGLDKSGIDEVIEMTRLGALYAGDHGLYPYYIYRQKNMAGSLENIGYAKPGKENLYNILMMEEKHSVLSCGAGSSTKKVNPDGSVERCENVKDISSYLERADEMTGRKKMLFR